MATEGMAYEFAPSAPCLGMANGLVSNRFIRRFVVRKILRPSGRSKANLSKFQKHQGCLSMHPHVIDTTRRDETRPQVLRTSHRNPFVHSAVRQNKGIEILSGPFFNVPTLVLRKKYLHLDRFFAQMRHSCLNRQKLSALVLCHHFLVSAYLGL